ncbi:MAG: response regulator transcription factor [Alphaproteobacteria bacterium]|nr:response regulator transcription factor [Alphaproteobacteria bacterium]
MKILIADDHELFLQGLNFVLKTHFDDVDITSVKNYTELYDAIRHDNYTLVITDLAMPGANSMDGIIKLHNLLPDTPIIVISAVFDREIVQKTIEIGVAGYIPKSSPNDVMLSAINLVLAGGVYIPKELLDDTPVDTELSRSIQSLKDFSTAANITSKDKKLTPRQIDVIKGIARGLPNKLIAYELGLTEGTVKVHMTVILKTLGVTNRTAAVMEAVKRGYISKVEAGL